MKEVVIHIGSPKTATSSIQSIFSRNSGKLKKSGWAYPSLCRNGDAHHLLVCDLIEKHRETKMPDFWYGEMQRGSAWNKFHEEVDSLGDSINKVFISSELFFAQTQNVDQILSAIKEELKEYSVKILVYLRRQDQLYASFYNQDVKGMRQWGDSAELFYQTHQMFKKSYFDIVEQWAHYFGAENVIVRPFSRDELVGGDIVKDICSVLGCAELEARGVNENDALGVNQIYVKRCLNRVGYPKDLNDEVLRVLANLLPEHPAKNVLYILPGKFQLLRKGWVQCNARLKDKYLDRSCKYFDEIPLPENIRRAEVSDSVLIEFADRVAHMLGGASLGALGRLYAQAAVYMCIEQGLTDRLPLESWRALMAGCR